MKMLAVDEKVDLSTTNRIIKFVSSQIGSLQSEILAGRKPRPDQVAVLARLRRGVNKEPGELIELLEFVIDPTALVPRTDEVTWSERAIYTSLTLYALHQQSQSKPMHQKGRTFAEALSTIRFRDGEEVRGVTRRFQAAATAQDINELVHHSRGLVSILRSKGEGFDYARFAADLFRYQDSRRRQAVRLAWGRDFYRTKPRSEEE